MTAACEALNLNSSGTGCMLSHLTPYVGAITQNRRQSSKQPPLRVIKCGKCGAGTCPQWGFIRKTCCQLDMLIGAGETLIKHRPQVKVVWSYNEVAANTEKLLPVFSLRFSLSTLWALYFFSTSLHFSTFFFNLLLPLLLPFSPGPQHPGQSVSPSHGAFFILVYVLTSLGILLWVLQAGLRRCDINVQLRWEATGMQKHTLVYHIRGVRCSEPWLLTYAMLQAWR